MFSSHYLKIPEWPLSINNYMRLYWITAWYGKNLDSLPIIVSREPESEATVLSLIPLPHDRHGF